MPIGATILHIGAQNNNIYLWALCDPLAEKEARYFEVNATGQDIYYDMGVERNYLGTVHLHKDSLIFHVFERTN